MRLLYILKGYVEDKMMNVSEYKCKVCGIYWAFLLTVGSSSGGGI